MRLDAGHVEDQYFTVELDSLKHVERQGDDRRDLRSAISEPSPNGCVRSLVLRSPIGAKRTVGTSGPKSSKMCSKNTSEIDACRDPPLKGELQTTRSTSGQSSYQLLRPPLITLRRVFSISSRSSRLVSMSHPMIE